jgi:hypothetical protein
MPRGSFRGRRGGGGGTRLTFDGEFDFEKANEELQEQLQKIKLADGERADDDGSGGSSSGQQQQQQHEGDDQLNDEHQNFYQKDNFFDNISCEATDRQNK